jgi:hypothetical protein
VTALPAEHDSKEHDMSALSDAEKAVSEARDAVLARITEPETGTDLIAALIATVRHHDAETVRALSRDGYSAQEAARRIDRP